MLAARGTAIGAWLGLAACGTRWDIMGRHGGSTTLLAGANLKEGLKMPEGRGCHRVVGWISRKLVGRNPPHRGACGRWQRVTPASRGKPAALSNPPYSGSNIGNAGFARTLYGRYLLPLNS
jgi:hypothetical protein